jgi:hypothetical protein
VGKRLIFSFAKTKKQENSLEASSYHRNFATRAQNGAFGREERVQDEQERYTNTNTIGSKIGGIKSGAQTFVLCENGFVFFFEIFSCYSLLGFSGVFLMNSV